MLTPEEKKSIIDYRRQKAYDNLNEAREVATLFLEFNGKSPLLCSISHGVCFVIGQRTFGKKSWRADSSDWFSICDKRSIG